MKVIDFIIIGIFIVISGIIIYRKAAGKSKGCTCEPDKCGECKKKDCR